MRAQRLLWMIAMLSLLPGCSLLVDFDPEGQPCDAKNQCLPGYQCVNNACVSTGAKPDGGTGGTSLCEDPAHCPEPPPQAR